MKKLLGISLGLVMLIGSVPLGFSEPMNLTDGMAITDSVEINKHTVPKSLYKQIQSGVSQNELVCANTNHVLAERSNGNLACVSERTADRMNWQKVTFTATIDDVLEELEKTETQKVNYITITQDDTSKNSFSSYSQPQPFYEITYPDSFSLNEEFEVTVSWQWFTEEWDDDNLVWLVDDVVKVPENYEGTKLEVMTKTPTKFLSDDGFDLELREKYMDTTYVYTKTFEYDESKVFSETLTFRPDSIASYPETNNVNIRIGELGQYLFVALEEEFDEISSPRENQMRMSHIAQPMVFDLMIDGKMLREMKMYGNDVLLGEDGKTYRLHDDGVLRPVIISDRDPNKPREGVTVTKSDPNEIPDHLWDGILEMIKHDYADVTTEEALRDLGFNETNIQKFLEKYEDKLETQSFQNPLSYFILPNAYGASGESIYVYGTTTMYGNDGTTFAENV